MPPKLKIEVVNARLNKHEFELVGEYISAKLILCSDVQRVMSGQHSLDTLSILVLVDLIALEISN
jgi:hypothetical protein